MSRRLLFAVTGLVAIGVALTARAATGVRGFPLRVEGTADVGPPLAVDLDGDGRQEIVVPTRNRLSVLEPDGSPLAGFPLELARGAGIATPLAAGPLARSARPSLVFGTADSHLAVVEADGRMRPGFPLALGAAVVAAPSLADLDGDGRLEILLATRDGRIHALDGDGRPKPGYPARVDGTPATAVTWGRLDPGADGWLLFGDEKGRLHAWARPGVEAPGFPYSARYSIASQPMLGDLDDDGRFEVVFGSKDYRIHAVESDGRPAEGFPVETGYRIYSACALADVSGDGVVDVVATSGDGKLYALTRGGKSLPGFPVAVGGRLRSSPVVGDVDLDGRAEIAVGSDRNQLVVVRDDGKTYPGYPARLSDRPDVAPLLVDLTGNGLAEILALGRDGQLAAFRMLKKGRRRAPAGWPAEGHDAARSGVVAPNPARYVELRIEPAAPRTDAALKLSYRFFDMDGDPEPAGLIRWYRDGKPVAELDGRRQVPPGATAKHQRWHFSIQAAKGARLFESPAVEIGNTPPPSPQIELQPSPPRTTDELRMKVAHQEPDADGDRIRYRIAWLRDRRPVAKLAKQRVPGRLTAKGQLWTVVVTPLDGEVAGAPARASIRIANSAPGPVRAKLVPARPTVSQPIRLQIASAARDPDGDPVRYLARWTAAGRALNLPADSLELPAGLLAKHGQLQVEITPFDGEDRGPPGRLQTELVNSPPKAPRIAIEPARPGTTAELRAVIVAPATDADRDPLGYRFSWTRSGVRGDGARTGARLPAARTAKGQRWTVTAVANDGEADGPPASAEVVIENSPPEPPEILQAEARPTTDQDLVIQLSSPPRDPDGDPAFCEVEWSLDGKLLAKGRDRFRLPAAQTRKHGRYLARLVPTDGQDAGPERRLWFDVLNSPPGPCKLAIEPARPLSGQALSARVVEASVDPDGDPVQMRFAWFRDGQPQAAGPKPERVAGERIARGQHWTVEARPFDGEQAGPACRASVVVGNRAPKTPKPTLSPAAPTCQDGLELQVADAERDLDGDRLRLSFDWSVDGRPVAGGASGRRIPAGLLRKGQRWAVRVVASDGELSSPPGRAEVQVVDSPPGAPRIEIRPARPLSSDDLHCRLAAATTDADGDRLEHRYAWFLERPGRAPEADSKPDHRGPLLPAGRTRKGQRWTCRAQASDGQRTGPPATSQVAILNAAPTAPEVVIEPARPGNDKPLRCRIRQAARDPDGDRIRYRFEWLKDGVIQKFAPETDRVPVRLTRPDDIWQCRAVASDGQALGAAAESQEVLIGPDGQGADSP